MTLPLVELIRRWFAALPPAHPFHDGKKIVVGVSGGVDSIVLLDLLVELTPALAQPLIVAHAHHGLRGADSDADAAFVFALASRHGLQCVTRRLPVPEEHRQSTESVEMTARRLRHAFLAETAREQGAQSIALAHHADDQIELFLLRLFRGSGGAGLGGMSELSPSPAHPEVTLVRPLLGVTRSELIGYAGKRLLEFREDASNRDESIPRNQIRHTVLPSLRKSVGPHLDRVLLRTADLVRTDSDYVQTAADAWLKAIKRQPFGRLHAAVQRGVVRRQLWNRGCQPDFDLEERLRTTETVHTGINARLWQRNSAGEVKEVVTQTCFQPGTRVVPLHSRGQVEWAKVHLQWRTLPGAGPWRSPKPVVEVPLDREDFDREAVGSEIHLRHWRPGDRFRSLGLPRSTKLQDLFLNRKIPPAERRHRVLATTVDGTIFWVEGLPLGEEFKVRSTTRQRLRWTWRRETQE